MSDLWTEAARDLTEERLRTAHTAARVATVDLWTTVLASSVDRRDFENRLATVGDRLDSVCATLANDDPTMFLTLRMAVNDSLTEDFERHIEQRMADAQRRNAPRAAARNAMRRLASGWELPLEGQPRRGPFLIGDGGKFTAQAFIDSDDADPRKINWWVEVWPKPQYADKERSGWSTSPGEAMRLAEKALYEVAGPGAQTSQDRYGSKLGAHDKMDAISIPYGFVDFKGDSGTACSITCPGCGTVLEGANPAIVQDAYQRHYVDQANAEGHTASRHVGVTVVACYSDHNEDIRTKGSCDMCGGTEPEGKTSSRKTAKTMFYVIQKGTMTRVPGGPWTDRADAEAHANALNSQYNTNDYVASEETIDTAASLVARLRNSLSPSNQHKLAAMTPEKQFFMARRLVVADWGTAEHMAEIGKEDALAGRPKDPMANHPAYDAAYEVWSKKDKPTTASRRVAVKGEFRINESTGGSSGQPIFTLQYMAPPDSWAYGVWEDVITRTSREECEAFIENPPEWWGNGGTTGSKKIAYGVACANCAYYGMLYCRETVGTCDRCGQTADVDMDYSETGDRENPNQTLCLDCLSLPDVHFDAAHKPEMVAEYEAFAASRKAKLAGRKVATTTTCSKCGEQITDEDSAGSWVSTRSGDDGGTYDICEEGGAHTPTKTSSLLGADNEAWVTGFNAGRLAAHHGMRSLASYKNDGSVYSEAFRLGVQAHHRIGEFRKGAPFAGYDDFDACVAQNSDKDDPEAYCGKIKHQTEDKTSKRKTSSDDRWYVHTNSVRADGTKDSFFTQSFATEAEARAFAKECEGDGSEVEVQGPVTAKLAAADAEFYVCENTTGTTGDYAIKAGPMSYDEARSKADEMGGLSVIQGTHPWIADKVKKSAKLRRIATSASELNDLAEFDHPIQVDENGNVTDAPSGIYAPSVGFFGGEDGQMEGEPEIDGSGWEFVDGFSRQDSYAGPVMHPSELLGGGMAQYVLDNPGVYVVTSVEDYDDPDNPAGWCLLKRTAARTAAEMDKDRNSKTPEADGWYITWQGVQVGADGKVVPAGSGQNAQLGGFTGPYSSREKAEEYRDLVMRTTSGPTEGEGNIVQVINGRMASRRLAEVGEPERFDCPNCGSAQAYKKTGYCPQCGETSKQETTGSRHPFDERQVTASGWEHNPAGGYGGPGRSRDLWSYQDGDTLLTVQPFEVNPDEVIGYQWSAVEGSRSVASGYGRTLEEAQSNALARASEWNPQWLTDAIRDAQRPLNKPIGWDDPNVPNSELRPNLGSARTANMPGDNIVYKLKGIDIERTFYVAPGDDPQERIALSWNVASSGRIVNPEDVEIIQDNRRTSARTASDAVDYLFRRPTYVTTGEWNVSTEHKSQPYSPDVTINVFKFQSPTDRTPVYHPDNGKVFPNQEAADQFLVEKGLLREWKRSSEAAYSDYPEGAITSITPGESMGTWNVFRKGAPGTLGATELATEWTPEMQAWKDAFYGPGGGGMHLSSTANMFSDDNPFGASNPFGQQNDPSEPRAPQPFAPGTDRAPETKTPDSGSPQDPPSASEQRDRAVARLVAGIRETNPGLTVEAAQALAESTIERFPAMVKKQAVFEIPCSKHPNVYDLDNCSECMEAWLQTAFNLGAEHAANGIEDKSSILDPRAREQYQKGRASKTGSKTGSKQRLLDVYGVEPDLVQALTDEAAVSIMQRLDTEDIPTNLFAEHGRGEALRRRAHDLVASWLIDQQSGTSAEGASR